MLAFFVLRKINESKVQAIEQNRRLLRERMKNKCRNQVGFNDLIYAIVLKLYCVQFIKMTIQSVVHALFIEETRSAWRTQETRFEKNMEEEDLGKPGINNDQTSKMKEDNLE